METDTNTEKKNDGGPAFPRVTQRWINPNDPSVEMCEGNDGISLRDYFAAKAMQGILANMADDKEWPDSDILTDRSYRYADAMLKAR